MRSENGPGFGVGGVKARCQAGPWRRRGLAASWLLAANLYCFPAAANEILSDGPVSAGLFTFIENTLPWPDIGRGQPVDQRQAEMTAFFEGTPATGSVAPLFRRDRRKYDIWFNPLPLKNVFFAGYDVSGTDHFTSIGIKRALGSTLDVPGFRFLASLGIKIAARDATTGDRMTRLHAVRASLGREFHVGNTSITAYAGTSVVMNPDGAVLAGSRRSRFGPMTMLDLWHNWPDGTFYSRYSSAFVMADQTSRSLYIRVRHGFGLEGQPWRIGPEVSFSSGATLRSKGIRVQDGWNRKRLGLHVSEIPLGDARLSVSCGNEWRERGKFALYAQAGVYFRY